MSVNLRAIQHVPAAASNTQSERTRARSDEARQAFGAVLDQEVATPAGMTRRPAAADTPQIPTPAPTERTLPGDPTTGDNLAAEGNEVGSTGTLSDDPRTAGMYVPPDFYHGTSYSPVFDHQDASGEWVATPRFEGQHVYGPWRGSLPDDYDPNARVWHDPLNTQQGPNWWKQDESGNWVKRETGYGGIPLNDDGQPIFTPDPTKYPEYFVAAPPGDSEES